MRVFKQWKKIGAAALTAVLTLSMGMTALADPTDPAGAAGTLTIRGTSEIPKEGAEFEIYPVLTFDVEKLAGSEEYVYTNMKESPEFEPVISRETHEGKTGIEAVAKYADSTNPYVPSSQIARFAAALAASGTKPAAAGTFTIGASGPATLPYGYYLVVETKPSTDRKGVKSAPMLVTVPQVNGTAVKENVEVTVKTSLPDISKDIVAGDGTVSFTNGAVGDDVKYRVKSDIPLYGAGVESFHYVITDTLSKGLDFNDDMKISLWVGENEIAVLLDSGSGVFDGNIVSANRPDADSPTVITVNIGNGLKADVGGKSIFSYAENGKAHFVLEYSAKINKNAVMGNDGNGNEAGLEYDDDHETDTKAAYVYTTSLQVIKKEQSSTGDATGTPLAGAEFKLLKEKNGVFEELKDENGEALILTTDAEGKLTFSGLSEGNYKLVEHKAPAGYNLDSTERPFTLTFDPDTKTWSQTGTENVIVLAPQEGGPEGTFETTIHNVKGMVLPGTGGMGTTIFKTVGGAIILLACVSLLIYYKKKGGANTPQ